MATTNADKEFCDYLVDMMQSIGPVYAKRMFGCYGIFLEQLMFALIDDRTLYLKVDADTKTEFIDLGLSPFVYQRSQKKSAISYYQCPEDAIEDPVEMNLWANKAYGAAIRASAKKKRKKSSK